MCLGKCLRSQSFCWVKICLLMRGFQYISEPQHERDLSATCLLKDLKKKNLGTCFLAWERDKFLVYSANHGNSCCWWALLCEGQHQNMCHHHIQLTGNPGCFVLKIKLLIEIMFKRRFLTFIFSLSLSLILFLSLFLYLSLPLTLSLSLSFWKADQIGQSRKKDYQFLG